MLTTNRIAEVYRVLGRILDDPKSFGLNQRTPEPLVNALTAARQKLMEELFEKRSRMEGEDFLAAELSQDADTRVLTMRKESRI